MLKFPGIRVSGDFFSFAIIFEFSRKLLAKFIKCWLFLQKKQTCQQHGTAWHMQKSMKDKSSGARQLEKTGWFSYILIIFFVEIFRINPTWNLFNKPLYCWWLDTRCKLPAIIRRYVNMIFRQLRCNIMSHTDNLFTCLLYIPLKWHAAIKKLIQA